MIDPRAIPPTPYIMLGSGIRFPFHGTTVAHIDLEDIVSSLSRQVRFNGHGQRVQSIAAHCLLVAELSPPEHRLAALVHDAAEAYTGDLTRPLKMVIGDTYHEIEDRLNQLVRDWAGLPGDRWPAEVKHADMQALYIEGVALFGSAVVDTWPTPAFPELLSEAHTWAPTKPPYPERYVARRYRYQIIEAFRER